MFMINMFGYICDLDGTHVDGCLKWEYNDILIDILLYRGESRGMGNKIATNHVIGTGEEKIESGVGGTVNSNNTQLYTQIYLLYK